MNIGLDYGTTYSILSFYNRGNDFIDTYRLNNSPESYIPSVVAIEDDGEIHIGETAKALIGDKYSDVYSRSKVLLDKDKKSLKKSGYILKTPKEITKIYLETLIENFKKDNRIETIDNVILTIPEIWLKDREGYKSRLILKEIMDSFEFKYKLMSEPLSAGAYFLYNYKKEREKDFNGHVLVFDSGGGTVDLTLLKSTKSTLKVLEREGVGRDDNFTGRAGVSFDERVIKSICNGNLTKLGEKNHQNLLNDFEKSKKNSSPLHEKAFERYINDNSINREICSLNCNSEDGTPIGREKVLTSHLYHSFSDLEKDINSILSTIKSSFETHGVDITNSDKFRVVMVGGSSKFYLSQKAVRRSFNAEKDDERFETYFTEEDKSLAISKGATLISENLINIEETYPITLSWIIHKTDKDSHLVEVSNPIFRKGNIVQTHNVIYQNDRIINRGELVFAIDNGTTNGKFKIKVDRQIEELFPNYNTENNRWFIGFSVDENSFVYVHIKDVTGEEKVTNLGYLLNDYANTIIVE